MLRVQDCIPDLFLSKEDTTCDQAQMCHPHLPVYPLSFMSVTDTESGTAVVIFKGSHDNRKDTAGDKVPGWKLVCLGLVCGCGMKCLPQTEIPFLYVSNLIATEVDENTSGWKYHFLLVCLDANIKSGKALWMNNESLHHF